MYAAGAARRVCQNQLFRPDIPPRRVSRRPRAQCFLKLVETWPERETMAIVDPQVIVH